MSRLKVPKLLFGVRETAHIIILFIFQSFAFSLSCEWFHCALSFKGSCINLGLFRLGFCAGFRGLLWVHFSRALGGLLFGWLSFSFRLGGGFRLGLSFRLGGGFGLGSSFGLGFGFGLSLGLFSGRCAGGVLAVYLGLLLGILVDHLGHVLLA